MTTLDGQWTYTYDAIGQLTHAVFVSNNPSATPNQDLQYQYDAFGNRTRTIVNGVITDYVTNNLNQYTAIGTAHLAYDADGNLISKSDATGTTTFGFNDANQLTQVNTPDGNWNYQYNAFGNRISTTHNGVQTDYVVDPFGLGNVVSQYDAGSLVAHYVHGLGLTTRLDQTGAAAYYDFDALGSTAGLSDLSGNYVNSYHYLPFGETLSSVQALPNTFTFVGQFGVMEEGSGLAFMRARFLSPSSGRFLSPDPWGLSGGSVNVYSYALNQPSRFIDPGGHDARPNPDIPIPKGGYQYESGIVGNYCFEVWTDGKGHFHGYFEETHHDGSGKVFEIYDPGYNLEGMWKGLSPAIMIQRPASHTV
jgi:RHS repeat-associated protein